MTANRFKQFDSELELAASARAIGVKLFEGASTTKSRAKEMRRAIIDHNLARQLTEDGGSETFAQAFERVFLEPLETRK